MGQRHQLFIIAKVGSRYRVLAALHHQWLYGITAVRQCLQLINLLQAHRNQAHIRRELQQAASRWSPESNNVDDGKHTVFPFITTCLSLGASLDEGGDFAPSCQIQPLSINTRYDAITNDDGISIYDVTSAPHVRYAFCHLSDSPEGEQIINAQEYFSSYDDVPGDADPHHNLWAQFAKLDLIDAAALESVWPKSKFRGARGHSNLHNVRPVGTAAEDRSKTSLKELATARLVMEALQSDPAELDWLKDAAKVADMETAIKDKLLQDSDAILLPSGAMSLARFVVTDTHIDLTAFPNITGEGLCSLIVHLPTKTQGYELVLPDIDGLSTPELKRLINTGKLRSLHLGWTPLIKLTSILKFIGPSSVKQVTHPLLYSRSFDLTIGKQFSKPEKGWSKAFTCGDGTKFPLRQMVYVTTAGQDSSFPRLRGGGIRWSQVESKSSSAVALPLEDSLMASDDLMRLIPMALRRLTAASDRTINSPFSASTTVVGIAKQAALQKDAFVSCVPAMMLASWTKAGMGSNEKFPKAQFLAPGEWTLLMCHERQNRPVEGAFVLRYAFASMDNDKKSLIIGAPEFFARFNKNDEGAADSLSAEWQHEMAGITRCDAEEVLEAMTIAMSDRR